MADTKTSALTTLSTCDMTNDYIPILDVSGAELKKITPDNLLDSDVGTWTGTISDGTNNATMDLSTGYYERHGREVKIYIYIRTTSLGSVSGTIRITGLPFSSSSSSQYPAHVGFAGGLNITAGFNVGGYISASVDHIILTLWDATTGTTGLQGTEWTNDGSCMLTAIYLI